MTETAVSMVTFVKMLGLSLTLRFPKVTQNQAQLVLLQTEVKGLMKS